MRINSWLMVAAALVVGFGVATVVRGGPRPRVPDPKLASPARSPEAPSRREASELQLLRAEVATLGAQLRAQPRSLATATKPAPSAEDEEPERGRAPTVDHPAVLQASYDAAFQRELPDAGWARTEERAIVGFFDTDAARGARLERVECHESMCRMRVEFADDEAHRRFMVHLGTPPFNHGGFHRTDENSGALTLYTAREGRSLPPFEADDAR